MHKIDKKQLLSLHDMLCKDAKALMVKKNQDYTGGTDDPFANFRGSESMGVKSELGLMIRMTDKMQRVRSFLTHGEFAVKDEGILELGHDLINYSVLLTGMLLERAMIQQAQNPPTDAAPEDEEGQFNFADDDTPPASDTTKKPEAAKKQEAHAKK